MKKHFILALAFTWVSATFAAEEPAKPYFDCWMENVAHIAKAEQERLGIKTYNTAWLCGCFQVEETAGEDWMEGETLNHISKVWDLPRPEIFPCKAKSCSDTSEAFSKSLDMCVDHLNRNGFLLADLKEGGTVHGAIATRFLDDSTLTDFGKYIDERKDRLDKVNCFFQYHERPDAPRLLDWTRKGVFSISGLPDKFLPETIGRFTDYSDVRCKDGNLWTGFLTNGYIENEMPVDNNGKFHGKEIGYGNDFRYPMRQGKEFGKVLWTAEYKMGKKHGPAKFYRYSAIDNINAKAPKGKKLEDYYFMHLEVPYRAGSINGDVTVYTHKGFLMAEVPYKKDVIDGRVTVNYPFVAKKAPAKKPKQKKKKDAPEEDELLSNDDAKKMKVTITYKNGALHGPNDLGYIFANYRNGKIDGKMIAFDVKEECFDWIPVNGKEGLDGSNSNKVCRVEKLEKQKWGTYKNGELQGLIECANGLKGNENIDCHNAY